MPRICADATRLGGIARRICDHLRNVHHGEHLRRSFSGRSVRRDGSGRSSQNSNGASSTGKSPLELQAAVGPYKILARSLRARRRRDIGARERRSFFAPLISNTACEIDVALLRQEAPGQLLGDGGDLDNRMKTLFDALRKPSTREAQQAKIAPLPDDEPIHCLLQDDGLVLKVSVETDRLLRPAATPMTWSR